VTPGSGPASSRSTRTGALWTRRHGGKAGPSHGEDKAPVLGQSAVWPPPLKPTAHLHAGALLRRRLGLEALARDAVGRVRPTKCPREAVGATSPTRGDDCQPRVPDTSRGSHPSFGGGEKHTRAALKGLSWFRQRSPHGARGRDGGGCAGDRRGEATSASPALCAGPATRPRGWGSAGRPGG